MGTASVHHDSFNRRLALIARKSRASEYGDCILHIAACAIWFGVEVDAGTFAFYAQCKHFLNGSVKRLNLVFCEGIGGAARDGYGRRTTLRRRKYCPHRQ